MIVISVGNNKGGVGKTFISSSLTEAYAQKYNVLAINLDSQPNMQHCFGMGMAESKEKKTGAKLMRALEEAVAFTDNRSKTMDIDWDELIHDSGRGFDYIPSDSGFANADSKVKDCHRSGKVILNLLQSLKQDKGGKYDIVVIDTAPKAGSLLTSVMVASHFCLIPVKSDQFSLDALVSIHEETLEFVRDDNEHLKYAIVMNSYSKTGLQDRDSRFAIEEAYPELLLDTRIAHLVEVGNATNGMNTVATFPKSKTYHSIKSVMNEIDERIGLNG